MYFFLVEYQGKPTYVMILLYLKDTYKINYTFKISLHIIHECPQIVTLSDENINQPNQMDIKHRIVYIKVEQCSSPRLLS